MNLDTMPVLVQRITESDDEEEIREYIKITKEICIHMEAPERFQYWWEFLVVARDSSHLQKIIRGVIKVQRMGATFWCYLEHPEFSYHTAGVILKELDENCIGQLRDMDRLNRS